VDDPLLKRSFPESDAGGTYSHDPGHHGTEHLSLDAVDFCRALAGRGHPAGLLTTIVPF